MKTFPGSVKLIVGPEFKKTFMPAYPITEGSQLLETDWEGREVVEMEFSTDLKLGRFKAFDYFGDGSYYIIQTPGHAVGHISGLARVSKGSGGEEDTFVFMGGDACHHGETTYLGRSCC